ncbi:glycosyltransferase family 2 protein [Solibacillus merdavium]|uniref:Glycosyltransferase family 2 protein n=1 Tax=Solibacillus merdavium TaxID=2762218 RepID=A0ABR8XKV6_9BACL|nr:glycosyltransferase family 2 protein [Solibacillus merdavium]MBD8032566.1 glycosyltransferase family 2 protein [Solibacillus merdavium]
MKLLSIILPAYNEEENINLSYNVISELMYNNSIDYELVYINDGSKDNTWDRIEEISRDDKVLAINFSRNFGKEAAIEAGLKMCNGDCAVVLDCDLQHPPDMIISMYRLWEVGYEVIEGVKVSRGKESFVYKLFSKIFYSSISKVTKFKMDKSSDFKLLDRKVINELNQLPEKNRFFRALSYWVGFKQATVEFEVQERVNGESKWSFGSLIKYAISNITSFTSAPLHLVSLIGVIYLIFATLLGGYSLISYFTGNSLEGFTTIILLLLLVGGTITLSIGILGIYINKIFEEIKSRPSYIISKKIHGKTKVKVYE